MPETSSTTISTDIVIIGGGIAGLWLLNRLKKLGYHAILLENDSLGCGQTVRSQGIIHGGLKYALNGVLTQASNAIADMPERWRSCLKGSGELDLSSAKVLSENHYLWSDGKISSGLTTFFASKAMRGRSKALKGKDRPNAFQHKSFKGSVYALNEIVLDVPSVIKELAKPVSNSVFSVDWQDAEILSEKGNISGIKLNKNCLIKAKRYIFTAGKGNAELLRHAGHKTPEMQLRPLHMVMVKQKGLPEVFAHCIGAGSKPRLTITTHPLNNEEKVWYLGGELAESGINRNQAEQLQLAQKELKDLFPWIEWNTAEWDSFFIERAEPKQSNLLRPDTAFVEQRENIIIGWPTKLALSPNLADEIISRLENDGVKPENLNPTLPALDSPSVSPTAWNKWA